MDHDVLVERRVRTPYLVSEAETKDNSRRKKEVFFGKFEIFDFVFFVVRVYH